MSLTSPSKSPRYLRTVAIVALTWSLGLLGAGRGDAPKQAAKDEKAQPSPTPLYFGTAACTQCHSRAMDGEPLLCRCDEVLVWEKEDKHRDAYQVLLGERARSIGKQLGLPGDVSSEKSCLACHGVAIPEEKLRHKTFKQEEGVSCVACHGAYREWVALHGDVLQRDEWRALSGKEKEARYGMKDIHDPIKRTRLCVSCHVGNAEEGKVVTHAMYAAGHPPLPGLEVVAFSEALPRHWQLIREKNPEIRKLLKVSEEEAKFDQTRLVLLSGVVTFEESMKLFAGEAARRAEEQDGPRGWPERGLFDCYACHHDLKSAGWRARRNALGKPGFPRPSPWPSVLVKASLRYLGDKEEVLDKEMQPLQNALDAQPFGKPRDLSAAVRGLSLWSDQLTHRFAAQKIDRKAALKLLDSFCALPKEEVLDYDSARQLAWAIESVYGDISAAGPRPAQHEAIQGTLASLAKDLHLRLPSGRKQTIIEQVSDAMRVRNDFDPVAFRRRLSALRDLLPRE